MPRSRMSRSYTSSLPWCLHRGSGTALLFKFCLFVCLYMLPPGVLYDDLLCLCPPRKCSAHTHNVDSFELNLKCYLLPHWDTEIRLITLLLCDFLNVFVTDIGNC